jgi:hypothetical protein
VYSRHYGAAANYSAYTVIAASAKNNVWVLGGTNLGTGGYAPTGQPVAVHWNGKVWSVAKHLPGNGGEVTGITALSATNVWVFGGGGVIGGISTWHFNGKTWQAATPKVLSGARFRGISAFSGSDVWTSTDSRSNNLWRYNGKAWARVTLPWKVRASVPFADGRSGLRLFAYSGTGQAYLVDRSPRGVWTRTSFPVPGSFTSVPGTTSWLAVGEKQAKPGGDAVVWADGSL